MARVPQLKPGAEFIIDKAVIKKRMRKKTTTTEVTAQIVEKMVENSSRVISRARDRMYG